MADKKTSRKKSVKQAVKKKVRATGARRNRKKSVKKASKRRGSTPKARPSKKKTTQRQGKKSARRKSRSSFSAAPSAIGYLYQCRYSLFESLRRLRRNEEFLVSIETLDDVVFEKDGEAPELLQTKHHINQVADLTDASPDLWKTIRIWAEGLTRGSIPDGSTFFLVTTALAGEGSAAYYLKSGNNRDISKAIERLNTTVNSSTSKANEPAYAAFRALTQDQKSALATAVSVIDGTPVIGNLDEALKEEVYFAAPHQFLDSFMQRLEGWWLRRAIHHLDISAWERPYIGLKTG